MSSGALLGHHRHEREIDRSSTPEYFEGAINARDMQGML